MSPNFIKIYTFWNYLHVSFEPIQTECLRISSNYFFSKIIWTFPLSQSGLSVSDLHEKIYFLNYMHVTSKANKTECLRTFQDFSDISNKIENRLSKRLRDAEFGQREILRIIENAASKVDGLSNSATEPSGSILHHDIEPEPIGNLESIGNSRNVSSNTWKNIFLNYSTLPLRQIKLSVSELHQNIFFSELFALFF